MSFWTFLKDMSPVLMAGATLYGANQTSKANEKAATTMSTAQDKATTAATGVYKEAQRAASPGLLATQALISRGGALTPVQEQQVADSRAQALNALKGSSLRGSARTTSAVVADTDKRVRDNLISQNQTRADSAAGNLTGQYFNSANNIANTTSQGLVNTGNINAANTIGQATISGQAIGDIGAIIADAAKTKAQEERDSSYRKITWNDGGMS